MNKNNFDTSFQIPPSNPWAGNYSESWQILGEAYLHVHCHPQCRCPSHRHLNPTIQPLDKASVLSRIVVSNKQYKKKKKWTVRHMKNESPSLGLRPAILVADKRYIYVWDGISHQNSWSNLTVMEYMGISKSDYPFWVNVISMCMPLFFVDQQLSKWIHMNLSLLSPLMFP